MKATILYYYVTAVVVALLAAAEAAEKSDDTVFLWSSTGGGWRSMCVCMGFANVFQQVGLMNETSSLFSGIATNSGASWFLVQLFYSQAFYDQVVLSESPDDLYNFTITWMNSYRDLAANVTNVTTVNKTAAQFGQELNSTIKSSSSSSSFDSDVTNSSFLQPDNDEAWQQFEYNVVTIAVEFYDMIMGVNKSWGTFVELMLEGAGLAIGQGEGFSKVVADSAGRLSPLQQTDMLIQSTLAPSSKVRVATSSVNMTEAAMEHPGAFNLTMEKWGYLEEIFGQPSLQDMQVFLGPLRNDDDNNPSDTTSTLLLDDTEVYSVGISAHYVVNSTFNGFTYATFDSDSATELSSYAAPTSKYFEWEDFEGNYLWPNEYFWDWPTPNASAIIPALQVANYNTMAQNMTPTGIMPKPFGGGAATVVQASAISSAFAAPVAPSVPSIFAQTLSMQRDNVRKQLLGSPIYATAALSAFDLASEDVYKTSFFDNAPICSQWPEPCGPADGYFLDGAFSDNPSVAVNIAQYQQSAAADLSKTIKLVITNTNQGFTPDSYDTQQLMQYFNTDFNQNVPPGDYVWLPGFVVPYRSPQIFEEHLTDGDVMAAIEPIGGSNMTTSTFRGTTIDNPAFGVRAGQTVEILFISSNEPITTFIAGLTMIELTTIPLANMVRHIAANQEMARRIRHFFFGDDDDIGTTTTGGGSSSSSSEISKNESVNDKDEAEEVNLDVTDNGGTGEAGEGGSQPGSLQSSSAGPSPWKQHDWMAAAAVGVVTLWTVAASQN